MPDKSFKGPVVVCSAFIEKDGKFLLVFDPRFRVWRVPGGKPIFDETLEQTLARELKEELGIEVENARFLGYGQDHQYMFSTQRQTHRLLMFFHLKTNKEPSVESKEIKEFKWLTYEELKNHKNKEGGLEDFFRRNPDIELS